MKKLLLILMLIPGFLHAKSPYPEKHYQKIWCDERGGEAEVYMPDRTWCDCLTDTHAVEVDFARKWYEALSQSLHYSVQTGKRPGVVLIFEKESDQRYLDRLNKVLQHYDCLPVDVWTAY